MSLYPKQLEELDRLLTDLADGVLDEPGQRALEDLLREHPDARDHYIRFLALCSDLHELAAQSLSAAGDLPDDTPAPDAARETGKRLNHGGHGEYGEEKERDHPFNERDSDLSETKLHSSVPSVSSVVNPPSRTRTIRFRRYAPIAIAAVLLLGVSLWLHLRPSPAPPLSPVVARIEHLAGTVELAGPSAARSTVQLNQEIHPGQTILTADHDAQATLRLNDGTLLFLAGQSRLRFPSEDDSRIDVEAGNVTASVSPRPAGRPLVFATAEAKVEVLGTRLSVACEPQRTQVDVLEGKVQLTRRSDQRTVKLASGESAEVSPQTDLRPRPIAPVPARWSLDFSKGLPPGWQTGQLVFEDLDEGTSAAVRSAAAQENGRPRFQLRSQNAWSTGLFTLHDDTTLHLRLRTEKQGLYLLYLVCRQADFGPPACTVLTTELPRDLPARQWHTLSIPLSSFRRVRTKDKPLLNGNLVAFQLVIDTSEYHPGLTISRLWVTRGTQGSKLD